MHPKRLRKPMKRLMITIIAILCLAGSANAEWIQFHLIERPYYDRFGRVITNITGRLNRTGIDEFYGGGMGNYPILSGVIVIESYELGKDLLIRAEGDIGSLILQGGAICSEEEADILKTNVFGIVPSVQSGTTP